MYTKEKYTTFVSLDKLIHFSYLFSSYSIYKHPLKISIYLPFTKVMQEIILQYKENTNLIAHHKNKKYGEQISFYKYNKTEYK